MPRSDSSRHLPRTLVIPRVMTLRTIADVRKLLRHVPADRRELPTWQHVAKLIDEGADPLDVSVALRLVLMLEHVVHRVK